MNQHTYNNLQRTIIPSVRGSIRCPPLRRVFLLVPLLLTCFAFSPMARAVTPPPDGGYLGQNTAEGTNALFSLTTRADYTVIGAGALGVNITGSNNQARHCRSRDPNPA
jgi:hypothetical protein